ncbi:MAG TPA: hypothetical protein VNV66_05485, partial [Pilimelia sp.]|nr:hypothetical protein [Pilimelia sp.]
SEAGTVELTAHLAAGAALTLAAPGGARYAAAVCALWGVAVDLSAVWPDHRRARLGVAAALKLLGWWLLLADRDVALVEAYLLPAAGVALLVGWLARRHGAAVGSWRAYGPALVTALAPSLATVYLHDPHPVRRLLLAAAAVLAVLAGARWRLRAPVVVGGVALVLSTGYELVRLWDELPRWIPLAAGGLLLVWVAMTLERRRRDAARLREALRRMT